LIAPGERPEAFPEIPFSNGLVLFLFVAYIKTIIVCTRQGLLSYFASINFFSKKLAVLFAPA
jgi:hypothetical protein